MSDVTSTTQDQRTAADRLWDAARSGVSCAPVRDLVGLDKQAGAYAVQSLNIERHIAAGRRVVGRKIGLTSATVQAQFGVYEPDYGVLLDSMMYADREPIALEDFVSPRIETEVAFVLGRDLDCPTATVADVLRATAFVLPALEIVDSRITNWDITISDTVADNASSGAVVLGTTPHKLDGLDLSAAGMCLEHRGEVVSTGAGAACLGSPAIAVAWLARAVARHGRTLRAGEIVLSGALGPMVAVTTDGVFHGRIQGLGDVRVPFTGSTSRQDVPA